MTVRAAALEGIGNSSGSTSVVGLVRGRFRSSIVIGGIVVLLATATPAAHAAGHLPTLRLIATQEEVGIQRVDGQVHLDLGVYAAAVGGTFRVDVRRDTWAGPVAASQQGRSLPPDLLDGFAGMKRFLRVTFRQDGSAVARTSLTFCPNGWDRQRVDDSGPQQPTFPDGCPTSFPFTRGMVWGIDAGWASLATGLSFERQHGFDVAPGDYEVTVEVAPRWADVLDVPEDGRRVTLDVTVVEAVDPVEEPHPQAVAAPADARQAVRTMAAAPAGALLPDLVALPAWRLATQHDGARDHLTFASTPWNADPGPFVVEGFRRRDRRVMDAFQYFHDASGQPVGRAPAGRMAFHAGGGHDHWHFLQLATFDLLTDDGRRVVRWQKQGFCLAPTDPVDLSVEGAVLRPHQVGLGSSCGGPRALWVREVLPVGWGDTYYNVSGQAFDITSVPNGRYLVRVRVDPLGVLHQTTTDNDEAVREIVLGGGPGARTVEVLPWNGVVDPPPDVPDGPIPA